jgi:RES domain-containing protein
VTPRTLPQKLREALDWAEPFSGVCYRNVPQRFANTQDILSAKGSLFAGGRYNFRGAFEVLYLSCDPRHSLEESLKSLQSSGFEIANTLPRTVVAVEVKLQGVLNLTRMITRWKLGITRKELVTQGWERMQNVYGMEAFTQQVGRFAREVGFEAILAPSAATSGKNLDVFPDRLTSGSFLKVINLEQLATR